MSVAHGPPTPGRRMVFGESQSPAPASYSDAAPPVQMPKSLRGPCPDSHRRNRDFGLLSPSKRRIENRSKFERSAEEQGQEHSSSSQGCPSRDHRELPSVRPIRAWDRPKPFPILESFEVRTSYESGSRECREHRSDARQGDSESLRKDPESSSGFEQRLEQRPQAGRRVGRRGWSESSVNRA